MAEPNNLRAPWNRGRKLPPEILTPDEVRALMAACSKRAPTGIRNRALISLLYRGLLRIDEALGLKPKDLDRNVGTVPRAERQGQSSPDGRHRRRSAGRGGRVARETAGPWAERAGIRSSAR